MLENAMSIVRSVKSDDKNAMRILREIRKDTVSSRVKNKLHLMRENKKIVAIQNGMKLYVDPVSKQCVVESRTIQDVFFEEQPISEDDVHQVNQGLFSNVFEKSLFPNVDKLIDVLCTIPSTNTVDIKMKAFLCLFAGLALFGKPEWVKLFFLIYGVADTGKSSYMQMIEIIVGSLRVTMVSDDVWVKEVGNKVHNTELLRCTQVTMAYSSEDNSKNKGTFQLNSNIIKKIVGERKIVFRVAKADHELELQCNFIPVHVTNSKLRADEPSFTQKLFIVCFQNNVGVKSFFQQNGSVVDYVAKNRKEFLLWALTGAKEVFSNKDALNQYQPDESKKLHKEWFQSASKNEPHKMSDDFLDKYISDYYVRTHDPTDIVTCKEAKQHFTNVTGAMADAEKSTKLALALCKRFGVAAHGRDGDFRTHLKLVEKKNAVANCSDEFCSEADHLRSTKTTRQQNSDDTFISSKKIKMM